VAKVEYQRLLSNELTVEATTAQDTTAPTVAITSPSADTSITGAQELTIVAGAADDFGVSKVEFHDNGSLIGTDTTNTFSTTLSLTEADNGTHDLTAVAYDAAGNATTSSPVSVTVNITSTDPYPAPALDSATLESGNYVLNWSLPSNPTGTPEGGYDIFIDGQDTGTTWRTASTSQTITGLDTGVQHSFIIEARWTQADPSEFPQSNSLTVEAEVTSDTSTDDGSADKTISGPLKVFPGAQGFGTDSPAGRGGQIIRVPNLNDSGTAPCVPPWKLPVPGLWSSRSAGLSTSIPC
jgi:hypothetical protein